MAHVRVVAMLGAPRVVLVASSGDEVELVLLTSRRAAWAVAGVGSERFERLSHDGNRYRVAIGWTPSRSDDHTISARLSEVSLTHPAR